MQKDKLKYQELLNREWDMFSGHNDDLITFDEYLEFNKVASAIEEIFAQKHSEDTVREWREENVKSDFDIEIPCSAELDLQMYNESI
tara:strand:+ start:309 stop:569 length:261 start_codon:yes stop_codon:yes gene_type:complete